MSLTINALFYITIFIIRTGTLLLVTQTQKFRHSVSEFMLDCFTVPCQIIPDELPSVPLMLVKIYIKAIVQEFLRTSKIKI